jgi:hypothetical protein
MGTHEPHRVADPPQSTVRTNWEKYTDGEWWCFRDSTEMLPLTDHRRANTKMRNRAHQWATRHGFRVEGRAGREGRAYYMRFISVRRDSTSY